MHREEALEILGFQNQSSPSINEIKKAYYSRAIKFHPDKHSGIEASEKARFEKLFHDIAKAYQFLLMPLSDQLSNNKFVCTLDPFKLYEEAVGENYDAGKATEFNTFHMRLCGLFAHSGMKEDELKISTLEIFRYKDGSKPGFSHTFRTVEYDEEYWKTFITPDTDSFKIHDYGPKVSAEARESLATLLANSPQIQHISCPPDFFNQDQIARIGRIVSAVEQLELHNPSSIMSPEI